MTVFRVLIKLWSDINIIIYILKGNLKFVNGSPTQWLVYIYVFQGTFIIINSSKRHESMRGISKKIKRKEIVRG